MIDKNDILKFLVFIHGLTKLGLGLSLIFTIIGIFKNSIVNLMIEKTIILFGIQFLIFFLTKYFIKKVED